MHSSFLAGACQVSRNSTINAPEQAHLRLVKMSRVPTRLQRPEELVSTTVCLIQGALKTI